MPCHWYCQRNNNSTEGTHGSPILADNLKSEIAFSLWEKLVLHVAQGVQHTAQCPDFFSHVDGGRRKNSLPKHGCRLRRTRTNAICFAMVLKHPTSPVDLGNMSTESTVVDPIKGAFAWKGSACPCSLSLSLVSGSGGPAGLGPSWAEPSR